MDFNFVLAQIIGIIALVILLFSFQKDKKNILLKYQMLSSMLYGIQYFLLGAYSGCLINFMCMVRNYMFNKYDRVPMYQLGIVLIIIYNIKVVAISGLIATIALNARCFSSGI